MWKGFVSFAALVAVAVATVIPERYSVSPLQGDAWAFLVAGSNGYYNYRHQADVCHSYHVMINEGIKPENIIVMMYDDIAFDEENPNPGVIINRPNGTNVYAGVKIDYKSTDVNPKNFLKILRGDKEGMKGVGTGRVIESNASTNVFVYFADHGATGILGFGDDYLLATDLENTIHDMQKNNKYKKLFLYIEACESGSMFDNILEETTDVYAMTAAARDESSYGWYCDENCLGDEFSVRWLEHMDAQKNGGLETFFHQYMHLRTAVTKSHVEIYGDFSLGYDTLSPNKNHPDLPHDPRDPGRGSYVNSRDVPLYYMRQKLARSNDLEAQSKAQGHLDTLIRGRKHMDELFEELSQVAADGNARINSIILQEKLLLEKEVFPCYKELLETFKTKCFGLKNEYVFQHFYKLANICILHLETSKLVQKMPKICEEYQDKIKVAVI